MRDTTYLTKEKAINCLKVDEFGQVHNFLSAPFGLVGADYELSKAVEIINATDKPEHLQIAGDQAKSMEHALAVFDRRLNEFTFFKTNMDMIAEYEKEGVTNV